MKLLDGIPLRTALEARCEHLHIRTGPAGPAEHAELCHDEHEVTVPRSRAWAMLAYADAAGAPARCKLSDRQVAVIPAGRPHQASWNDGGELTTIMLKPAFLRSLASADGAYDYQMVAQFAGVDPFIWHMARSIEQQLRLRGQLQKTYLESAAVLIGQHLLNAYCALPRADARIGGLPRHKVRRAIDFIRANYRDNIGFRDIAGQLDMSPYHFARMFKQSTGESPHQFIMRCRIEAAKQMLVGGDMPIADIAFEVGYKSQSYFTTRFAQLAGVTPAAFRCAR